MKVLIGTPTSGNIVTAPYAVSLVNLSQLLSQLGANYSLLTFDGADIELARNVMAMQVMSDPSYSHLLFLDSDMDVPGDTFARLFDADHDIAGAIYPKRALDHARYAGLLADGVAEPRARAQSSDFVVRFADAKIQMTQGWCRVAALGTGCLLIKRAVFDTLVEGGGVPRLSLPDGAEVYDLFGRIERKDGSRLSEDFSFCVRAVEAGFDIWGLADAQIGHIGAERFSARFVDRFGGRKIDP